MRIIRRKKGKVDYFYLQHSYRENRKVVTVEKYLGKVIPANIEEIREEFRLEANKFLYEKLEKIRRNFQGEWRKYPETAKEREKQEIAIAFTYNTNAIEGSTITLEETRGIIQDGVAPTKPLKDIKETESHAKVFLNVLNTKGMSNELLLKWHKEIFGGTKPDIAGKFRKYLIRVGAYVAPDWHDITRLMSQLMKFVNETKLNPVELAARAHYRCAVGQSLGDGRHEQGAFSNR